MNRHEKCVDEWVKRMKTDRQRLDWIESQKGIEIISYGTQWKLKLNNGKSFQSNSLREVLYEAMNFKI